MKPTRIVLKLSALIVVVLFLAACPASTKTALIKSNPSKYKDVKIMGTVTDTYSAAGANMYEIEDDTGRIWVVTNKVAPSVGSLAGIEGNVATNFSLAGREFGTVVQEKKRKIK
jgi:hypothetical protein